MKILVITDNTSIYENLKQIIEKRKRDKIKFVFKTSPKKSDLWEHEDFKDTAHKIDVKSDCDYIIGNFKLVISMHCKQLFPEKLVKSIRCINIHPGYNPINRGWYPQTFSIVNNLPIGVTIHEMDEKLDNGPIIARKFVEKSILDTSYSLYQRILSAEIELFDQYFDTIIDNSYVLTYPENEGNIFFKRDFMKLCKFEIDETDSFINFYNRIRALTHAPFKNAYFIDPETNKKVYLEIVITQED